MVSSEGCGQFLSFWILKHYTALEGGGIFNLSQTIAKPQNASHKIWMEKQQPVNNVPVFALSKWRQMLGKPMKILRHVVYLNPKTP